MDNQFVDGLKTVGITILKVILRFFLLCWYFIKEKTVDVKLKVAVLILFFLALIPKIGHFSRSLFGTSFLLKILMIIAIIAIIVYAGGDAVKVKAKKKVADIFDDDYDSNDDFETDDKVD